MSYFGFRIALRATTSQNCRCMNPFARAAIVKRERRVTAQAFHAAGGQPLPPDGRFLVKLVRIGPTELDEDNLAGSLKAVRDELAKQLGLANDNVARVRWFPDQRSEGHVREKNPKNGRTRKLGVYAVEVLVQAQRCADCHVEHCDCIHDEAPCSSCAAREAP